MNFQSSGHFIDGIHSCVFGHDLYLNCYPCVRIRCVSKSTLLKTVFTKCEQQPGLIYLVVTFGMKARLMLGDRRYRIATDSAPTSKSAISIVTLQQTNSPPIVANPLLSLILPRKAIRAPPSVIIPRVVPNATV